MTESEPELEALADQLPPDAESVGPSLPELEVESDRGARLGAAGRRSRAETDPRGAGSSRRTPRSRRCRGARRIPVEHEEAPDEALSARAREVAASAAAGAPTRASSSASAPGTASSSPAARCRAGASYTCKRLVCFERAVSQRGFARVLRQTVRVDPSLARLYTEESHG